MQAIQFSFTLHSQFYYVENSSGLVDCYIYLLLLRVRFSAAFSRFCFCSVLTLHNSVSSSVNMVMLAILCGVVLHEILVQSPHFNCEKSFGQLAIHAPLVLCIQMFIIQTKRDPVSSCSSLRPWISLSVSRHESSYNFLSHCHTLCVTKLYDPLNFKRILTVSNKLVHSVVDGKI